MIVRASECHSSSKRPSARSPQREREDLPKEGQEQRKSRYAGRPPCGMLLALCHTTCDGYEERDRAEHEMPQEGQDAYPESRVVMWIGRVRQDPRKTRENRDSKTDVGQY